MKMIKYKKTSMVFAMLAFKSFLKGQDLVILHTNDVHSNIEPLSSGRNAGFGGFQRRANYIESIRKEHPNVKQVLTGGRKQTHGYTFKIHK